MLKIYGVPFSAHTRKVIIVALEKNISYDLEPVIPLDPPKGWEKLSPTGLIPAIEDGPVTLADSSVISLYLEKKYPSVPFYPASAEAYGQALWIEEYVDGAMAKNVLKGVLMPKIFGPKFLNLPVDEALVDKSINELIPPQLDYLESQLTGTWFAGDNFSIADVAVASILINYAYASEGPDEVRHPKLVDFLHRALNRESFREAFKTEIPAASQIGELDLSLYRKVGYKTFAGV